MFDTQETPLTDAQRNKHGDTVPTRSQENRMELFEHTLPHYSPVSNQPMSFIQSEAQGHSSLQVWLHNFIPLRYFKSLKMKLGILIVIATSVAFVMSWILLKYNVSGWIAMPISLLVALAITYIFSRGLTSTVAALHNAAKSMEQGNYTVRLHVIGNDELSQLAYSFNSMAEELEHADKMRRDLIANVSHELRTPISALQALVENMADGVVEPTPANLEGILDQTHHLTDLIAFLLDLSRMEAGAASLNITQFDFHDFIEDTLMPLEIADAGHAHHVDIDIPHCKIEADQDRLRQLFTNIIGNAMKHSPDNTDILIEAHENTAINMIITNVINFGSQIPVEARSDIFRRYVKDKGKPGTSSGGTGLGLSIARWAADLHGGSVEVVDDRRGVNFEIRIPQYTD